MELRAKERTDGWRNVNQRRKFKRLVGPLNFHNSLAWKWKEVLACTRKCNSPGNVEKQSGATPKCVLHRLDNFINFGGFHDDLGSFLINWIF